MRGLCVCKCVITPEAAKGKATTDVRRHSEKRGCGTAGEQSSPSSLLPLTPSHSHPGSVSESENEASLLPNPLSVFLSFFLSSSFLFKAYEWYHWHDDDDWRWIPVNTVQAHLFTHTSKQPSLCSPSIKNGLFFLRAALSLPHKWSSSFNHFSFFPSQCGYAGFFFWGRGRKDRLTPHKLSIEELSLSSKLNFAEEKEKKKRALKFNLGTI